MTTKLQGLFAGISSHVFPNRRSNRFRRCTVRVLALAVLGVVALCSNAFAQSGAGSIQGTVMDSTGAVIPNASIHVVNEATGVVSDTKSNGVGFYQVPGLFTGTYDITITAPGMKTTKQTLELLVGQNAVIDAKLTAGAVTQQVQVSANVVQLVTTNSGVISDTLGQQEINQLPVNGHNILALMGDMTPGFAKCTNQTSNTCPNGLPSMALEIMTDGVTSAESLYGGENTGSSNMTDSDAIQEVRTLSSGIGAEYATPAVSIMQTKSGTNRLHGSMFETTINNYWGVAKVRQNPAGYAAPHQINNEFGANVGGPIVLPHVYHGKDKSFWFFAYERTSSAAKSSFNSSVPTAQFRNGDFSGLTNGSGTGLILYDPATTVYCAGAASSAAPYCPKTLPAGVAATWARDTYTHEYSEGPGAGPSNCNGDVNCIPSSAESPTAKTLNDITPPVSSNLTAVNPLIASNSNSFIPNFQTIPQIDFRLDHVFNENNRAYLRYGQTLEYQSLAYTSPEVPLSVAADGLPAQVTGLQDLPNDEFQAALGFTHVFSPTFFSETVLSEQWFNQIISGGGPAPYSNYEQTLGFPNNFGTKGFPEFIGNIYDTPGDLWAYGVSQVVMNGDENLSKTIGKHQLKFGGRYRFERIGIPPLESQDYSEFSNYATGLLNASTIASNGYAATNLTGGAEGDFFLGASYGFGEQLEPPYTRTHQMELDGYLQDDFHVSRNLTLNLGIRYEAHPATLVTNPAPIGFDMKNDARVLGAPISTLIAEGYTTQAIITNDMNDGAKFETPQQAGLPNALMKNQDVTLGPRFGFAYQLFGGKHGTVIRGGYGRYIFPSILKGPTNGMQRIEDSNPYSATYSMNYTGAALSPDGLPSWMLRSPQTKAAQTPGIGSSLGTPILGVNTANVVNTASTTSITPGIQVWFMDPSAQVEYATEVNLSVEKALPLNSALRISWLWSHGSDIQNQYGPNTHPSNFVYEMQKGVTPPNGGASTIGTNQYASTATGPYDQVTWNALNELSTNGWSNNNQLQINYQRLFHGGFAYGFWMTWEKTLIAQGAPWSPYADYIGATGNLGAIAPVPCTVAQGTGCNGLGTIVALSAPPPPPPGAANWQYYRGLGNYEGYMVSTAYPPLVFQWNGIVDIPVGKGKWLLGNANHFVDEFVGGYQIATNANMTLSNFAVASSNWGPTNPVQNYKKSQAKVTDCTSGTCHQEYLWFNGYITPSNNANTGCTNGKCVSGLPSSYQPYQVPIDNVPGTTYYGSNEVGITLLNGTTSAIAYSPGPTGNNPFAKTVLNGPFNWTEDVSLYKVFPIREQMAFRFNMDTFNVFNEQGLNTPNTTTGLSPCTDPGGVGCSSKNSGRRVQLTLRFSF